MLGWIGGGLGWIGEFKVVCYISVHPTAISVHRSSFTVKVFVRSTL